MQTPERKLFRLASTIHEQLVHFHQTRYQTVLQEVQHLLEYMESLQRWRKRMTICNSRHMPEAARKVAERLQPCLRDVPFYVGEIERTAETCKRSCPSVSDVFAEIRQLQAEFERFEYNAKQQTLSVTTEAIVLEDVYLGEFSIQLHVDRLSQVPRRRNAYRIVALDPHPATTNDSVTHPHVRDEELCAGDATAAIATALETGRVCDFFLLVRSVLTTYNGHSPYVPLTEWNGRACNDCGYVTDSDESYYCEYCSDDYCSECISYCRRCDTSVCRSCLETCPVCDEPACPSCMNRCPDCKRTICTTCLEAGECECRQEEETDEPETQEEPANQEA